MENFLRLSIKTDGISICYAKSADGNKPVIVFIHGFRSNHTGLADIINTLDAFSVIAPDIPGYGSSQPLPDQTTLLGLADNLLLFIGQVVDKPFILIGHSLGATLALLIASKQPRNLIGLILFNPVTTSIGPFSILGRLYYGLPLHLPNNLKKQWFSTRFMVKLVDNMMFKSGNKISQKKIIDNDYKTISEINPDVLIGTSLSYDKTPFDTIIKRINVPTYILGGDADLLVPVSSLKFLSQRIETSELAIFTGKGHLLPVEEPELAGKLISSWILKQ